MAAPFTTPLPAPGDKPWTLNPVVEEVRSRIRAVNDLTTTGRLGEAGLEAELVAGVSNPESALNGAVFEVVAQAVGSLATIPQINDARGNLTKARIGAGPQMWLIGVTDGNPLHARNGDLILPVSTEPVPWSPLALPGLVAFFDASYLSLADGASVSTWPNLADGPDAVRFDGTTAPVFDQDGLNGKPTVRFNGSNGVLLADGFSSYSDVVTVFCVAQSTVATPTLTDFIFDGANPTTTTQRLGLSRTPANQWRMDRGGANFTVAGANTDPHLFRAVYNGEVSSLKVDNTVHAGSTSKPSTATKLTIGGRGDALAANSHVGGISALLMIHGTVSADNETKLRTYLNTRFGI